MNQNVSIYYQVIKKLMNNNISDDGILYYIALKSLYNPSMEKVFINVNTLYYQLYNTSIKHDKNITKVFVSIENALKELEHIEVIKILSTTEHNYLIDMSGLHCDEYTYLDVNTEENPNADIEFINGEPKEKVFNAFYQIELSDIQSIIKIGEKTTRAILRYYFEYLSILADVRKTYFMLSREELNIRTKIDKRSIDKYNNILEENHLIYIARYDYKYCNNGHVVNNLYTTTREENIKFTNDERDKFIKQHLDDGTIYLSKSYSNKGKNTKEYKENLAQQHEDVIKHENIVAKKSFGRRASKMIDDADSVPKSTEQSVNKFTGSNNVPKDTVVQDKWWIAIIKNKDNDIEIRRNLACKFDCMELLEDEIPMPKKANHEMLTFD